LGFVGVVALVTALGWGSYKKEEASTRLVVVLLYLDSVVGLFFYYLAGEFETPNLAVLLLPIVMAPMFADKRHAWGIAGVQTVLYIVLLGVRATDWLPYGYLLDAPEAIADGEFVMVSIFGFLICTWGAAFLAGVASLEILTSQKELTDEVDVQTRRLARTNAELGDRNRALDEFNAALSHDLKSPLQTALLAAEALIWGKPRLSEAQKELADTIVNSTSRMGDLTRELLKLSRMTDVLGDGERVEVRDVLNEVMEDLGARLAETRAELLVAGELPAALANPSLLREALQNLVENALKYGDPDTPRIRVEEVDAPWGRVAFAVEDNGLGIPEDQRDLVFRPFLRLNRDKDRGGGVGAGLAIVQRIVSVHGGKISVEDGVVLKGARFVVELSAYGSQETLRD
jgi:signal transduction histidine kinase